MSKSIEEVKLTEAIASLLWLNGRKDMVWSHIPMGEYRRPATGARLKRMGTRAGFADMLLCFPNADGSPAIHYVEIKRPKTYQSKNQKAFQAAVESVAAGCAAGAVAYHVVRTLDEAHSLFASIGAYGDVAAAGL